MLLCGPDSSPADQESNPEFPASDGAEQKYLELSPPE
jgi:hypothetical protein